MAHVTKLPLDFTDLLIELCETHAEFLLVGGCLARLEDIGESPARARSPLGDRGCGR